MRKKTTKDFINHKMNDDVYKLRRQVIDMIYEIKNVYSDIPRIDVRIGKSKTCGVLGLARLNDNIIWIDDKSYMTYRNNDFLRNVVYHEILHAIYGIEHDEKCPLMCSKLNEVISKDQCLKIFGDYYRKRESK
jgi:hypothetical protein|tara:strand:- start:261 stop:659 length:399 start_codon:yes stop_codon:yes gene_type:complete